MLVHNATRGECADAPRTEKHRWTNEPEEMTCPTCKPKGD